MCFDGFGIAEAIGFCFVGFEELGGDFSDAYYFFVDAIECINACCTDYFATAFGLHALKETVYAHSAALTGLIGSLC